MRRVCTHKFRFMPVSLCATGTREFRVISKGLVPSLTAVSKLKSGTTSTIISTTGRKGFLSGSSFHSEAGIDGAIVSLVSSLGLFKSVPRSGRVSLFSFAK